MMMTVAEYNKYVQDKKSEMLETADKDLNSQKQIALVTLGEHYDKFIMKIRDIFEEFGYVVHWYHYNNEIINQLDMGIEIADIRQHYDNTFVFNTEIDWRFSNAVYRVASGHVPLRNKDAESLCVLGNDDRMAVRFVSEWLWNGKRVIGKPVGVGNLYSDMFDSDMIFIFDHKARVNCYPIHKPIFYIFPWSVVNTENRNTYDMSEEIILEVIKQC